MGKGVKPWMQLFEPSTFKDLFHLSEKTKSLILGKLVHSHMIRTSYRPDLFMHNVMLNMYCKCADMASAQKLFDRMPSRDVVTWNSLIAGYARIGCSDQALSVFKDAKNMSATLDQFSYAGLLSVCGDSKDLKTGRVVHSLVVVNGLANEAFMTNSLIDMYSKCGMVDEVRLVFDHAAELDEVSWNSLLSAYTHIGWPEVATNILVWMHRSGVKLNNFALASVLKACSSLDGNSKEVQMMIHGCVVKIGLDLDLFVGSAMLDLYAKNGGLEEAVKVFASIPNPNVVVLNAMIAGFSRLGTESCHEARPTAFRLFSDMLRRQIRPSKFTFKSLLEACNLMNAFYCGRKVHAQAILNGFQDDEFIASALIALYASSGCPESSLRCFLLTPRQKLFTWTSMISAYTQNGHFELALSLFTDFLRLGKEPDQFTVSAVMSACSYLGVLYIGQQVQAYSMKSGLDQFTICGNSQIDMYTKMGDLDASCKVFQDIGILDVVSWSSMIFSYALHGKASDSLMLFEKMVQCKVVPSQTTFLAVLTACSHAGLLEDGFRYFEKMRLLYGLDPQVKHFACIVNLLGRCNKLVEAENMILSSRYDNDPQLWHVLLRACLYHGDTEKGICAGEKLILLEPLVGTSYMLLYNIYMGIGKMSLAMRTRGLMRERGLNKEKDTSWIEIGTIVHSFGTGSNSHLKIDVIHAKLQEALSRVQQKKGNTAFKIECQSETTRHGLVNMHSVLLAVALGISSLPGYELIRVAKSKSVCRDCHTLLKLFSETERRDIVLRDPIRFHHFSWGSCSCGDYW